MKDINDIMPKVPNMRWGALLNKFPTNSKIEEMNKIFPDNGKWHTVFEENEGKETLPTIKKECERCGNDEAVWWMLQTRSADEPTTQFYRCSKCAHTWRDYS